MVGVLGIRYWNGVVVVVVLCLSGCVCRCDGIALVCVLCDCLGVSTVLVW